MPEVPGERSPLSRFALAVTLLGGGDDVASSIDTGRALKGSAIGDSGLVARLATRWFDAEADSDRRGGLV